MPSWLSRKLDNPLLDLLVRLAIAIPLAAVGLVIFVQGISRGGLGVVFTIPAAALCFVLAAVPIAPWVAERLAAPAGNLFYPDRRFDRPQPLYSLAEGKRARGEFREAIEQYECILAEHPGDVGCFIGMMDIAATELRDPALVTRIAERGREEIPEQARQQLDDVYAELIGDFS